MKLTRVQICEKFGVHSRTFDIIEELLHAKPEAEDGRSVYDVQDHDKFVLECARAHAWSFVNSDDVKDNAHLLPFHRFLILKFMTVSLDELMLELQHRNLASPKLGKGYLEQLQKRFVGRLPKSMKKIVKAKTSPPGKLKGQYKLLLKVLGVALPYQEPIWVDDFFRFVGDHRSKTTLETVLTTDGDLADHQKLLVDLTRSKWNTFSLDFYSSLFYDLGAMSDSDWHYYTSVLPPSERRAKREARLMTTAALRVKESGRPSFQDTLQTVALQLQRKLYGLIHLGTENVLKEVRDVVTSYTKIGLMSGEGLAVDTQEGYFSRISISPAATEFKTLGDDDIKMIEGA